MQEKTKKMREIINNLYGSESEYVDSVLVRDVFNGETVWEGVVEVFDLVDHPKASKCYVWAYPDNNKDTKYIAVINVPPINKPLDAIRAAIASGQMS